MTVVEACHFVGVKKWVEMIAFNLQRKYFNISCLKSALTKGRAAGSGTSLSKR